MREKERRKLLQMNDWDYFIRPEISGLLTAVLRNITKKRLSVTLVQDDSMVAYTSGVKTVVNVLNQLTQGYALRRDKLLTLIGLVGHEAGHVLFSDFDLLKEYMDELETGALFESVPFVDPKYADSVKEIKEYYTNREKVTGTVLCCFGKEILNIIEDGYVNERIKVMYPGNVARGLCMVVGKLLDSYPEAEILLESPLAGLIGILHQYAVSEAYAGNTGVYQDLVNELIDHCAPVLRDSKASERQVASLQCLMALWPYIKEVIDATPDLEAVEDNEDVKSMQTMLGKVAAGMPQINLTDLEDADAADCSSSADVSLEGLDEMIASNMNREDREEMLTKEHDDMQIVNEGNINVKVNALPIIPADADQKVLEMKCKLRTHIRRMVESTKHLLEDRESDILDGQICGGKLGRKLYRRDQKLFTKKIMPGPDISMAVGILVDESGSMACDNERNLRTAREMAFMAYQFCKQLEIPVSVVGHGVRNSEVMLDVITDFEKSVDDERAIATIGSHISNYDAYAIEYIGKRLLNRTEETKVLFVVSDGAPSFPNSKSESELIHDIQNIVGMLRKNGVIVIATAMDMELSAVQAIYDKDCMNISDFGRVPALFPRLLAKYIG